MCGNIHSNTSRQAMFQVYNREANSLNDEDSGRSGHIYLEEN